MPLRGVSNTNGGGAIVHPCSSIRRVTCYSSATVVCPAAPPTASGKAMTSVSRKFVLQEARAAYSYNKARTCLMAAAGGRLAAPIRTNAQRGGRLAAGGCLSAGRSPLSSTRRAFCQGSAGMRSQRPPPRRRRRKAPPAPTGQPHRREQQGKRHNQSQLNPRVRMDPFQDPTLAPAGNS